jgi:cytochrome c-type biogenesis protein CcmH/NrfF
VSARLRASAAALATLLLLAVSAPGAIAATCPKTSTQDIADEVMCLQCGVPLNLAENAPSAKRERAFIDGLVAQCKSKSEVKAALVAQFGDNVLAEPQGGTAWLVPALAFVAAVLALGFAAFRWRRRRATAAPIQAAQEPAGAGASASPLTGDAARLQQDLDRYDL